MKTTGVGFKLLPSILNIVFTYVITVPVLLLIGFGGTYKLFWVAVFFAYNAYFEFFYQKRDPGMIICHTAYERDRSYFEKICYVTLYTLSFSTLLFYIWIPFDVLLINLLLIQLPCIVLTGNTLHGYVCGNVKTIHSLEK